jgi:hypothetical protein
VVAEGAVLPEHLEVGFDVGVALLAVETGDEHRIQVLRAGMAKLVEHPGAVHAGDPASAHCSTATSLPRSTAADRTQKRAARPADVHADSRLEFSSGAVAMRYEPRR